MAYHYENLKLEKGMYGRSGRSFSQTLEELDPSEHYRGTPLEGLDAFQRQLKRFDIRVKGAGSDMVEKFFHTTDSAVLFPEFVSRVVRQGLEEESILPDITATVTSFDGMDYRSIASVPTEEDKALRRVGESVGAGKSAAEAWRALLPTLARRGASLDCLTREDISALTAFFDGLGAGTRAAQEALFQTTLRELGRLEAEASKNGAEKGRLYATLGLLCGLTLAIAFV